jgi:hypothetical protein
MPQLLTLVLLFCEGTQVPLGSLQPSQVVPPPPPVPVPPPVPPAVQVEVAGLQVDAVAEQSMQALPDAPQVVLLLFEGFLTQVFFTESQQPSQFWGPHLAGLHEGAKATTKPTTAPSVRALIFIGGELLLRWFQRRPGSALVS